MDKLAQYRQYLKEKDKEFESVKKIEPEQKTEKSKIESALRGAAQGATLGFADELTAKGESLFTGKPYEQALAESRQAYKESEEANPMTYMAGDIGSSVLLPTGKIGALAKLGKAATSTGRASKILNVLKDPAKIALEQGTLGAIEGVGRSEKEGLDSLEGLQAGVPSAIGAGGLSLAGKGIGKLASVMPDKASVIGTLTMRDPEMLRKYANLKNPELYSRLEQKGQAQDIIPEIAQSLEGTLKETPFRKKASRLSSESFDILKKSDMQIDPTNAIQDIDKKLDRLKDSALPDIESINYLEKIKSSLEKEGERYAIYGKPKIPASRVKSAIQTLEKDVGFGQDYKSGIDKATIDIRKMLDTELKKNPQYADIMKKTAAATEADKRIQEAFTTKGVIDPDKILKQIKSDKGIKKDRNLDLISAAMQREGVQSPMGANSMKELIDTLRVKNALDTPSFQGSNLMNYAQGIGMGTLGGGIGAYSSDSASGLGVGTLAGGILGNVMQRKSGQIARKAMDFKTPMPDILNRVKGTPYENVLSKAAQVSPRKFAVNSYLLQQKDPEYRQLLENE